MMPHRFQPTASRVESLLLGLLLLFAAGAKCLSLTPFFESIEQLSGVSKPLAAGIGLCVILAECGAALALLVNYRSKEAAYVSAAMFTGFAAALSRAIVRGIEIPCNCFGNLGPPMPLKGEVLLDLVLCVLALHLAGTISRSVSPEARRIRIAAPSAAMALLWGSVIFLLPHRHQSIPNEAFWTALHAKIAQSAHFTPSDRMTVILLADFDDFGCHICLDDFLAFCDSLEFSSRARRPCVQLIAARDSAMSDEAQERRLKGWAAGNRYTFPLAIDRVGLFETTHRPKTSVLAVDEEGKILLAAYFPLGPTRRQEFLRAVTR
ncbi:MAG TPA: MauE/DoxX family redox-associated membrane protein [Bacteroidota bacterium]|nr:MauE/DoxX family redox-associated membrane protein [Bacteroidota bacterium]